MLQVISRNRILCLYALVLALITGLWFSARALSPQQLPQEPLADQHALAGRDFIIYWSAWQCYASDAPLYSLSHVRQIRGENKDETHVLHNPPWCLWLVAPVAWLPYSIALIAWQILLFASMVIACLLCSTLFRQPLLSPKRLLLCLLFPPLFLCWFYGQLTLPLTVVVILLFICLDRRWDEFAGGCLALMTIKPQIYFLLAFLLGLHLLYHRRWRVFLGFFMGFGVMQIPLLMMPTPPFGDWFEWVRGGQGALWRTSTLSTWVRFYLPTGADGYTPTWPMTAIPLASLTVATAVFWGYRKALFNWPWLLVPLTCLSLLLAPYAWAYDYCLLIPFAVLMMGSSFPGGLRRNSVFLATLYGIWYFQLSFLDGGMHYYVWFPIAVAQFYYYNTHMRPLHDHA